MTRILIIREFPQAQIPSLRVQVGEMEMRTSRVPVYDDQDNILRFKNGPDVEVFRCKGNGPTLKHAIIDWLTKQK